MNKTHNNPNASASIITRNLNDFTDETENIYESITIIAKRARQISTSIKEELNEKLAEFATTVDNLEEIFENREQIEISKQYERMPKPTALAIQEFQEGRVMFRRPEPEEDTDQKQIAEA